MQRDFGTKPPEQPAEVAQGRRVVAVIGIDKYAHWPQLSNAVSDADGTRKLFLQLGFEELVPPLLNDAAHGDAIRQLVIDDLAKLGNGDSLVIFFAGHGHTQSRQLPNGTEVKTGFIVPADGEPPTGKAASWLRLDSWLSDVARLPVQHVLVILDACHSGIALGELIKWRGEMVSNDPLDRLSARQSRRVITSALDDERALDSGPVPGHSLFTGVLIQALSGAIGATDRRVTGSQLGLYVQQRVRTYPGAKQTPDFGALENDDRGELVIPLLGGETVVTRPVTDPPVRVPDPPVRVPDPPVRVPDPPVRVPDPPVLTATPPLDPGVVRANERKDVAVTCVAGILPLLIAAAYFVLLN